MQCAWCKEIIPGTVFENSDEVSHGICKPCAQKMFADNPEDIKSFIDNFNIPVALVSTERRVQFINKAAETILNKKSPDIKGQFGGEVFDCIYSSEPEGCGGAIHCYGCVVKNTVLDTAKTGKVHRRVPATLKYLAEKTVNTPAEFYISTWLANELVVLMVEDTSAV